MQTRSTYTGTILSSRLKGNVFCCTGLQPTERSKLQEIVEHHGGIWSRHLTNRVTHLLCKRAEPSDKYKMAMQLDVKIIHPDWIYDQFTTTLSKPITGNDSDINADRISDDIFRYLIKPLTGAVISVSSLSEEERITISELCSKHGAVYSSDLTKKCTHLVVPPKLATCNEDEYGVKVVYALKWMIPIVSIEWIHSSIQQGYILSVQNNSPSWLILPKCTNTETSVNTLSTTNIQPNEELQKDDQVPIKSKKRGTLFSDKKFFIDHGHQHIIRIGKLIKNQSGIICMRSNLNDCDYYVVSDWIASLSPSIQSINTSITFITEAWIERCSHDMKIHNPSKSIFYQPFPFLECRLLFLKDLSISFTGFEGTEREYLTLLFKHLESSIFPHFTKKMDILLCPTEIENIPNTSMKSSSATKWCIPMVQIDWLWECLKDGEFKSIKQFVVNAVESTQIDSKFQNSFKEYNNPTPNIERKKIPSTIDLLSPIPNVNDNSFIHDDSNSNQIIQRSIRPLMLVDERTLSLDKTSDSLLISNNISNLNHEKIFHGIHCCFSQRLWHRRDELTNLVENMGGACSWTFSPDHITHFVHQGTRLEEKFKEFKLAKKFSKLIVSPWWIIKSRESNTKLPENEYPHTYDPLGYPSLVLAPMNHDATKHNSSTINQERLNDHNPLLLMINQVLLSNTHSEEYSKQDDIQKPISSDAVLTMLTNESSTCSKADNEGITRSNVIYDHESDSIAQRKLLLGSIKPNIENLDDVNSRKDRKLLFSSISIQQQSILTNYINELGDAIILKESEAWSNQCTHLIAGCPSRSEKYLAAIVCGVFICKVEYIEASWKAKRWLEEKEYMWKSGDTIGPDHPSSKLDPRLLLAPGYWRKKLESNSKRCFSGWYVLLDVNEKKRNGLKRLLEAGDAVVELTINDPYSNIDEKKSKSLSNNPNTNWTHIITDNSTSMNKKRRCNVSTFSPDIIVETLLSVD